MRYRDGFNFKLKVEDGSLCTAIGDGRPQPRLEDRIISRGF